MLKRLLALAVLALAPAGMARGTTLVPVTMEESAKVADMVVLATVASSEVFYDQGTRDKIHTRVTLAVEDDLVGNLAGQQELVLTHPGGTWEGTTLHLHGHPEFIPGQRYVLFLWDESRPWPTPVVGWNQGAFMVLPDAEGVMRVHNSHGAFPIKGFTWQGIGEYSIAGMAQGAGAEDVLIGWPGEPAVDLATFLLKVEEVVLRAREEVL